MTTPAAPSLSVKATADKASYTPGDPVAVDAAAFQSVLVQLVVSATLASVTANTDLSITVDEAAANATFGISDNTGNQIQWTMAPGSGPGTQVFSATIPAGLTAPAPAA